MYQVEEAFTTPMHLYLPETERINGKVVKTYSTQNHFFYASFKTYGGTESTVNGVIGVEDTATVKTWYDPIFVSGAKVTIAGTDREYEIITEPENVEMRNRYTVFKVKRIKGGA